VTLRPPPAAFGPQNYDLELDEIASSGLYLWGYVGDSCGDNNYMCRVDTYHLDISTDYLRYDNPYGISNLLQPIDQWKNRKVEWEFVEGTPPGCVRGT